MNCPDDDVIEKRIIFVNMNGKNSILLVDPEFDLNNAESCTLLLRVTLDSFCYAIIDRRTERLTLLFDQQECHNPTEDLFKKLNATNYLLLPFREIKASFETSNSIAVPNALFNENRPDIYAQYFPSDQSQKLFKYPVKYFGFTSVFNLEQVVVDNLTSGAKLCKIYDHAAPLYALANNRTGKMLILDFTAKSFLATYCDGAKAVFNNYYQTDTADEFNYYLLLILTQLDLDTTSTNVFLSGLIHEDDKYFAAVRQLFRNVTFLEVGNENINSHLLEDLPLHYYSTLLAIDLCE